MSYELTEKIIPTINFLDPLSINNYGHLRKLLLNYGIAHTQRIQLVYTIMFIVVLLIVIINTLDYLTNGDHIGLLKQGLFNLPLLWFVLVMLFRTA